MDINKLVSVSWGLAYGGKERHHHYPVIMTYHDDEPRPKVDNTRTKERNNQSSFSGHQRAKKATTKAGAKLTAKHARTHQRPSNSESDVAGTHGETVLGGQAREGKLRGSWKIQKRNV